MPLHRPYFAIKPLESGGHVIIHNCDGALDFQATDNINEETYILVKRAIEEGKRQKAREIAKSLGIGD